VSPRSRRGRRALGPALAALCVACADQRSAPVTEEERTSYAVGLHLGARLREMRVTLDPEQVIAGVVAASGGRGPDDAPLGAAEVERELATLAARATPPRRRTASVPARADTGTPLAHGTTAATRTARESAAFLAANRARDGVIELPSGVQYRVAAAPDDALAPPAPHDRVTVEYEGRLLDGAVFDTSRDRFAPTIVRLARAPRAWREVLPFVPGGATVEIWVPAELDPAEHPVGLVPAGEVVAFTVRVTAIDRHPRPDVARSPP